MNIRSRDEHTYEGHSISVGSTKIIKYIERGLCGSGHSNCMPILYNSLTEATVNTLSVSNVVKTTKRVLPLHIRRKDHSHTYEKVSASIKSTGVGYTLASCKWGHSSCVLPGTTTVAYSLDASVTEEVISYKPSPPINIRAKIPHTHNNLVSKLSVTYRRVARNSWGLCGENHHNCRNMSSVNLPTSISTQTVNSDVGYE